MRDSLARMDEICWTRPKQGRTLSVSRLTRGHVRRHRPSRMSHVVIASDVMARRHHVVATRAHVPSTWVPVATTLSRRAHMFHEPSAHIRSTSEGLVPYSAPR